MLGLPGAACGFSRTWDGGAGSTRAWDSAGESWRAWGPGADPQGHWGLQAGQCPYDSGWVDSHLVPEWDAWSRAGESALCLGRVVQYGAAAERRTAPKNFARGWDTCLRPAASACLTMSTSPYPYQGRHEGAHQTCCCPGCCAMIPVGVRVGAQ